MDKYNFIFYRFLLSKNLLKTIKRLPNFSKYISKFLKNKNTSLDIHNVENDWRSLCRVLTNPSVKKMHLDIITYCFKLNNLIINENKTDDTIDKNKIKKFAKCFGSLFSISFFPDIVCSNNVIYKNQLIKKTIQIVKTIDKLRISETSIFKIISLSIKIEEFINLFVIWQNYDKEFITHKLAKGYILNKIKIDKPLSENSLLNDIYINAFKQEQIVIKQDVEFLHDKQSTELFNFLIKDIRNYEQIEKYFYWQKVKFSLYDDPPKLDVVLELFKETKRLMKNLVSNREDLKMEIDEVIDEEMISKVLEETIIDEQFYFRKCKFIVSKLKQLQSASQDKKLDNFTFEFKQKIINREYFRDLIPFFFRFVLDNLELVHDQKNAFYAFIKDQHQL